MAPGAARPTTPACRLGDLLARTVDARPDAPAVTDGGRTATWRAFARRAEGLSAQLAAAGVERGGRVALWLPNGLDYLLGIFAVARRGALAVHINTRFGPEEVGDLLDCTGATLLLTRSAFPPVDFLGQLERVDPARLARLRTVLCHGPSPARVAGRPVLEPTRGGGAAEDLSRPDDPCLTYATGGTTARPKLVVHAQRSIAHHAGDVAAALGAGEPGAALLAAVPFCGTFGNAAAMAAVAGGAHLVCMDAFDAERGDALTRAHGVTHLIGDDRMLGRLAAAALDGPGARGPHRGIRFFGFAGFNPDAAESCRRSIDAGFPPRAIYGSSEVQALFALGDPALGGWGAVAPVSPGAGIDVLPGAGEGPAGELAIRGPSLFSAYLDDPAATAGAMSDEGWFRTGDLAEREGRGFVFHGRTGDVLRLGGFLVNPGEIESFLQRQPGVEGAQVVGVEVDGRAGRGVAAFAFVIPASGAPFNEAALLSACRGSLARHKVPARAVAVASFPTSTGPNGPKISRAELRRRAQAILDPPPRGPPDPGARPASVRREPARQLGPFPVPLHEPDAELAPRLYEDRTCIILPDRLGRDDVWVASHHTARSEPIVLDLNLTGTFPSCKWCCRPWRRGTTAASSRPAPLPAGRATGIQPPRRG